VLLAQVLLPPGARFTLPTSVCQDVLVYVRHGATELDGGRPLLPGRAVRFGLDGAALGNTSGRDAEVYVIVSRSVARRFGPDATLDMQLAPVDPACGEAAPATGLSDLGAQPLVHAGGELRVNILLDEQGQGARHAALTRLDASAAAGVPLHTHEDSAEVIFIEEGEGRMLVGDQHVAVRPGTFVYIPPRTPHSFTPSGNSPLRAMQVYAPAGPEQRFRELPPSTGSSSGFKCDACIRCESCSGRSQRTLRPRLGRHAACGSREPLRNPMDFAPDELLSAIQGTAQRVAQDQRAATPAERERVGREGALHAGLLELLVSADPDEAPGPTAFVLALHTLAQTETGLALWVWAQNVAQSAAGAVSPDAARTWREGASVAVPLDLELATGDGWHVSCGAPLALAQQAGAWSLQAGQAGARTSVGVDGADIGLFVAGREGPRSTHPTSRLAVAGLAAIAAGVAQRATRATAEYALVRQQFGHPIADFQAIQFMLADSQTGAEAARLMALASSRPARPPGCRTRTLLRRRRRSRTPPTWPSRSTEAPATPATTRPRPSSATPASSSKSPPAASPPAPSHPSPKPPPSLCLQAGGAFTSRSVASPQKPRVRRANLAPTRVR
jgi:mannose-6-phosphate isomerase-like protein (cupin superfamily)